MLKIAGKIFTCVWLLVAWSSTGFSVDCALVDPCFESSLSVGAENHAVATTSVDGETNDARWTKPTPQTKGDGWVYELFTPPDIFFDELSNEFRTASSPTRPASNSLQGSDKKARDPLGLQLKEVKRSLFRLQLIGFIKSAEGPLGLFENIATTEIIVAHEGTALPQLGVSIESLVVRAEEVAAPELMVHHQICATAMIRDQVSGLLTRLTSAERSFDPEPKATLVDFDSQDVVREVSKGDVINVGDSTYEIAEVRVSPPQVVVMRRDGDRGIPAIHTLNLPEENSLVTMVPST